MDGGLGEETAVSCNTTVGVALSAGLRHTFGSGLSTINPNSRLGKAVTHGCGHQMFISPLGVPVP